MDEVPRAVVDADLLLLPLEPADRNKVQGGAFTKLADAFAGGRPVLAHARSAAAAAVNRKRALAEWEENKKRWREMGVPPALPAAGSTPKK